MYQLLFAADGSLIADAVPVIQHLAGTSDVSTLLARTRTPFTAELIVKRPWLHDYGLTTKRAHF